MAICPICEKGTLKPVQEKHVLFGVDLGTYPGEKCTQCGEVFTDASVMEKIETTAKKKGIWGLGKKTKIARAGNSLAVRIPKEVADYLKLKEGKDAYLHPEEKKIIIELD
ncbi:AbrB/MazE/SpoVT family DNA-binding domain-containing protein [Candidatus Woesearchaeota archaeon]|nr:AbrB/MazE/SpoVT family DNA-binding domain-containing protein [Candidatus Woesearchaeota archaeon]